MTDPMELVGRLETYRSLTEWGDAVRHEIIDEAAACIREMVEWRPIETAPRDGSRFLAYGGGLDDQVETCSWSEVTCCWNLETFTADDSDDEPEGYCRPTHWLPFPPAPGAEA